MGCYLYLIRVGHFIFSWKNWVSHVLFRKSRVRSHKTSIDRNEFSQPISPLLYFMTRP